MLRKLLLLDAAVCGLNAVAYVGGAGVLDSALGIPPGVLRAVGAFLAVYAVAVGVLATRPRVPASAVRAVVVLNVIWALDSLVAAAAGWWSPTAAGRAWLVAQALAVAGIAAMQWRASRPALSPATAATAR